MRKRTILVTAAPALALLVGFHVSPRQEAQEGPPGMILWETVTSERIPATPELLARGEVVYGARCGVCHGMAGRGDGPASLYLHTAPRDFTRLEFKLRTTEGFPSDLDLFRSITAGFPVYGMPSFAYLPEEDRWALVHQVQQLAREGWLADRRETMGDDFDPDRFDEIVAMRMDPGAPLRLAPEPPADPESITRGRALYATACLPCHGEEGRGDGPSAPTLRDNRGHPIPARDFGEATAYRKAGWRTTDTVRVIRTGLAGTPMPTVPQWNDAQLWDVARYVESLAERNRE